MKIYISQIKEDKSFDIEEEMDFSSYLKKDDRLVKYLSPMKINASLINYAGIIHCTLKIKGDAILICSRTLDDIPRKVNLTEELDFSDEKELVSEDVYPIDKNFIELDSYIYGAIYSSFPSYPIKKGSKLPPSGYHYDVFSEDEYEQIKKQKPSPFDVLDDVSFDDENK